MDTSVEIQHQKAEQEQWQQQQQQQPQQQEEQAATPHAKLPQVTDGETGEGNHQSATAVTEAAAAAANAAAAAAAAAEVAPVRCVLFVIPLHCSLVEFTCACVCLRLRACMSECACVCKKVAFQLTTPGFLGLAKVPHAVHWKALSLVASYKRA